VNKYNTQLVIWWEKLCITVGKTQYLQQVSIRPFQGPSVQPYTVFHFKEYWHGDLTENKGDWRITLRRMWCKTGHKESRKLAKTMTSGGSDTMRAKPLHTDE